jgi:hypothetical protein
MPNWLPVAILTNLDLRTVIEAEFAAIVPQSDDRASAAIAAMPPLGDFLSRFHNAFGQKLSPAILLIREDAPKAYFSREAISGFRDAAAIPAIALNRALQITTGNPQYFVWANFFMFYPWMVAKDGDGLVALTPAMSGYHEVEQFHGQCSPELFIQPCDYTDFDRPLQQALLQAWERRFSADTPAQEDIRLFRALNMAFAASTVPSGTEITYYDVGRQLSLWVSAFEILSHPGPDQKANLETVYGVLQSAPWHLKASAEGNYDCVARGKGKTIKSINACWIYGQIYQERNNFLHGNPVAEGNLRFPSGRNIYEFAAPLFRMALAHHLDLRLEDPSPDENDKDAMAKRLGALMRFYGPQDNSEKALLAAHKAP